MFDRIITGEGLRLVKAFFAIRDPEARKRLIEVAESAARDSDKVE